MLMNPAFADHIQAYGAGGLRAQKLGKLATVGAGVLVHGRVWLGSSGRRLAYLRGGHSLARIRRACFALDDASTQPRRRLNLPRIMRTDYRIDNFQQTYFVINSLDDLLALAKMDFAPLYEQLDGKADIAPNQLVASDVLFNRGTGSYHHKASKLL